jgi:hypothetical protein
MLISYKSTHDLPRMSAIYVFTNVWSDSFLIMKYNYFNIQNCNFIRGLFFLESSVVCIKNTVRLG